MTEKKLIRKRVKVKKEDKLGFNWFFWISAILIAIPCIYFVSLLLAARKETNVPVNGDRIVNSIKYEITSSDVQTLQGNVKTVVNVENCEANLIVETLRISIDAADGLSVDQYKEIAVNAYNIVNEKFPVDTYFSKQEDFKQYDLEIIVYDSLQADDVTLISLNKNSGMTAYTIQVLSEAVNPDLAAELRANADGPKTDQPVAEE